jgi:glyoxylase-like metal-dependent hydrolase (beta-lactamase superfamily II)
MSEGFHRPFTVPEPVPGCAVVPVRWVRGAPALIAATPRGEARILPHLDDGELVVLRAPLRGVPAPAAAAALMASSGFGSDGHALAFAGRWVTPESAPERWALDVFLAVARGLLPEGLQERPARAWCDAFADGRAYPGPLLGRVARALAECGDVESAAAALREALAPPVSTAVELEVRPGVTVLPLRTPTLPPATHTNCVIAGGGDVVVVDPASPYPEDREALLRALERRLARGERVRRIVLTHHHGDHVGGVTALREHFDVPVVAHPETAARLRGAIATDEFVLDGDAIAYGQGRLFRALHTPGHAPGHIVLHDEASGLLVVGDMVAGLGTIVVDPPEGRMADYLAQLERLAGLGGRLAVPAHGPVILDPKHRFDGYIAHRLWREERILAALSHSGPSTPDALVPRVYDDVPKAAFALAARQLLAHLERLQEVGAVARSGRRWARAVI